MTTVAIDRLVARFADLIGATAVSTAAAELGALGDFDPMAVVSPGSPAEAAAVLNAANELGVAAAVTGCGTKSTAGWPAPDRRHRVAVSTRRLSNVLELDEVSLVVHAQCGIQVGALEETLGRQGLTLGPYPSAILTGTLGGLLAAPPPTAYSPRTGFFADGCLGLSVAQVDGSLIETRVAPRRATGPDLARLYLGSRGSLGMITSAVLRVHRLPELVQPLSLAFPSLEDAVRAARLLLSLGLRPACVKVLDARLASEELDVANTQAALILVLWGPASQIAREQCVVDRMLPDGNGVELPRSIARRWWEHRAGTSEAPLRSCDRVAVRLTYTGLYQGLRSVPALLQRARHVWIEEFSMQGATLWLSARDVEGGATGLAATLREEGLVPYRLERQPLAQRLRARFDPGETLVVLEI